ncbi:hypothetical protein AYJ54_06610 [Bradyrhizobium centrolobii]|uniref:3-hydroxyisobutyryl-CoA hydrolase n=2 Tax=Bradyrhizobium centrolobii TaxID=1505087 RepID=A0A176YY40_9BRAD|nr:hypothetical protein AYJ54_06610 [Bradyrhizobium centrolobii]
MIRAIRRVLDMFAEEERVRCISIASAVPNVFCAGGDIRAVRTASLAGRHDENEAFFSEEYQLNLLIANYPKPYMALIDGICMGGGMGLSVHGRHRVVTASLKMAMPETSIGYFPDVGASYFLGQLPLGLGNFLALTGHSMSAEDAMYCGLANLRVSSATFVSLMLPTFDFTSPSSLTALAMPSTKVGHLEMHDKDIEQCFNVPRLGDIFDQLRRHQSPWSEQTLAMLKKSSPTSLVLTFELMRRCRNRCLAECLDNELKLTRKITRSADFMEGVRAALVEKDKKPSWHPQQLSDVDASAYFDDEAQLPRVGRRALNHSPPKRNGTIN